MCGWGGLAVGAQAGSWGGLAVGAQAGSRCTGSPGLCPAGPPGLGAERPDGGLLFREAACGREGARLCARGPKQQEGGGYAGNGVSLGAGEAWLGRLEPPHPPLLSPSRPEGPAHHVAPTLPPNTGPQRAGCSRLGPGLRRPPWDEGGGPGVLAPGQTLSRVEVCIRPVTCPHTGRRRATAER